MSMVRCDKCERPIDSDVDCGCFVSGALVLCKWCREDVDEEPVPQAINNILDVLDCFMAKANSPATVKEIEAEAIGIGQIQSRAQLILSFIEARKAPKFKVISNG